ncbi:MAG: hypothetical protein R3B51_09540 [Thermodesulfobacteriota bacterium]
MNTIENVDRGASNIVVSTVLLTKPGIITSVAFTGFAGMVLASKYRSISRSKRQSRSF